MSVLLVTDYDITYYLLNNHIILYQLFKSANAKSHISINFCSDPLQISTVVVH